MAVPDLTRPRSRGAHPLWTSFSYLNDLSHTHTHTPEVTHRDKPSQECFSIVWVIGSLFFTKSGLGIFGVSENTRSWRRRVKCDQPGRDSWGQESGRDHSGMRRQKCSGQNIPGTPAYSYYHHAHHLPPPLITGIILTRIPTIISIAPVRASPPHRHTIPLTAINILTPHPPHEFTTGTMIPIDSQFEMTWFFLFSRYIL